MSRLSLVAASLLILAEPAAAQPVGDAPRLIASFPADGAVVPAGETVLSWTFDRSMKHDGWSVTGLAQTMPLLVGKPAFSPDGRTFRQTMRLAPGRSYDLGVNSTNHRNFRSAAGVPAQVRRVRFRTAL